MPELALYRNPTIEYVPRVNLQVADKTLATMQQNHLKTIELQGELAAAVNAMDLDESENDYKAGLIDDIEKTVEDSTVNGYAGYALDDIIKKLGDINGNQLLKGKIDANAAHKKYIADIQARNDITQDTKDRFIELNPYDQYAKYMDENHPDFDPSKYKEAGTYTWQATNNPVKDIPLTDIFAMVGSILEADKSSWDTVTYVGADGIEHPNYKAGDLYIKTSSGSKEYLTKEKIQSAWDAVLDSNPEYRKSIQQGLDNLIWKAGKNGITPEWVAEENKNNKVPDEYRLVLKADGNPRTLDEYIDLVKDEFAEAKKYNRTTGINNKLTPIKTDSGSPSRGKGNGNGVDSDLDLLQSDGSKSPMIEKDTNKMVSSYRDSLIEGSKLFSELDQRYNLDYTIAANSPIKFLHGDSLIEAIKKSVGGNITTDVEFDIAQIRNNEMKYGSYYNNIESVINSNDASLEETYNVASSYMQNGGDLADFADSDNKELKRIANANALAVKSIFTPKYNDEGVITDEVDKIKYSADKGTITGILNELGFEPSTYKDEGIEIADNGASIILNKSGSRNLTKFSDAVRKVSQGGAKGKFYRGNHHIPGSETNISGYSRNIPEYKWNRMWNNEFYRYSYLPQREIEALKGKVDYQQLAEPETVTMGSRTYTGLNPRHEYALAAGAATGDAAYNRMAEDEIKLALPKLGNGEFDTSNTYLVVKDPKTGNNIAKSLTSLYGTSATSEKQKFIQNLQAALTSTLRDKVLFARVRDDDGDWGYEITYPTGITSKTKTVNGETTTEDKYTDTKTIRIYENFLNDPDFQLLVDTSNKNIYQDIYTSADLHPGLNIDLVGDHRTTFGYRYIGSDSNNIPKYQLLQDGNPIEGEYGRDVIVPFKQLTGVLNNYYGDAVLYKAQHQANRDAQGVAIEKAVDDLIKNLSTSKGVNFNPILNVLKETFGYENPNAELKNIIENYIFAYAFE